jgi:hypothetical protein
MAHGPHSDLNYKSESARAVPQRYHYCSDEFGTLYFPAYLKIADKRLGLLINFNVDLIKEGIKRVVNGLLSEGDQV